MLPYRMETISGVISTADHSKLISIISTNLLVYIYIRNLMTTTCQSLGLLINVRNKLD